MLTLAAWTLWLHIAAGTVAVLAGLGALVTEKGGLRHRQAGKSFVVAMGVVVVTTVLLAVFDPTSFRLFLVLVAVFSGYLAFSGYRVLSRKRPADEVALVDWVAASAVVLACLALGGWGITRLVEGATFGGVLVVFGGIGLGFAYLDVRSFRTDEGGEWMVAHLQRMIGAFVATISAVSAVNLTDTLGVVAWLWPTVALTPLIVYWSRKYE